MALQYSDTLRNNQLAQIEATVGTSAVLKIYDLTAGAPANVAAAITGTVLATLTLPSDWMAAPSGGTVAKTGTWQDTSADASGTADFFRLFASDGTTCHAQGTITSTATGTGDMLLDNPVIAAGQSVTIGTFSVAAGNA